MRQRKIADKSRNKFLKLIDFPPSEAMATCLVGRSDMFSMERTRASQMQMLASWATCRKTATRASAIPEMESPRMSDESASELSIKITMRLPAKASRHVLRKATGARSSKPKMLLVKRNWRFQTSGPEKLGFQIQFEKPKGRPGEKRQL